jgi:hypothetical protein
MMQMFFFFLLAELPAHRQSIPIFTFGASYCGNFLAAAIYECSNEMFVVIIIYTFMWLVLALWVINSCQINQDKDFQGQPQTFLDTS